MFRITNKSTTYLAIQNANLAPGQFTDVLAMNQALQFLRSKGAIKVDVVSEKPVEKLVEVVRPAVPVLEVPTVKKKKYSFESAADIKESK